MTGAHVMEVANSSDAATLACSPVRDSVPNGGGTGYGSSIQI
jgi:hypothetical protein